MTGGLLISDGWTSIQNRPIINALLSTPVGARFLKAIDTSGQTKDAQYIADFMCDCIIEVGADKTVAVCMDGACRSSFPLIRTTYPHVFCYICPTHSLDNFLKNVCSSNETIRVASVKTANDDREFEWGCDVFRKPIDDAWEVIKFITNHGKALSLFRDLAKSPSTWVSQPVPAALELLKHCETRFASHVLMLSRYLALRVVVELLMANPHFKEWLKKQKTDIKKLGASVKLIVQSDCHWTGVKVTVDTLVPILELLRLTDGKTGATLGKVYHHMST